MISSDFFILSLQFTVVSFKEIRDRLQETYKTRKCDWCHKPCKDCDQKCKCLYCKFPESYDSLDGSYQNIKEWVLENLEFYEKLYKKGLGAENILVRKWHKRQLFTIEKTGTRILDWIPDYEIIGVPKSNHHPPEGYRIITPYYDYRRKKDLKLNYCQICGRDIDYDYYIKHEERKECIKIGHECATAFCLADLIVHNLKKHMREIVEKEFRRLEYPLKNTLKKKISKHPPNEAKLTRTLERITRHFGKGEFSIPAQEIAKLLLELKKDGIKIIDEARIPKKPTIVPEETKKFEKIEDIGRNLEEEKKELEVAKILDKNIRILILEKIRKMSGVFENAVNEDRIILEMQIHGMSREEIICYLEDMLKRKEIFEFLPHQYKITNIVDRI